MGLYEKPRPGVKDSLLSAKDMEGAAQSWKMLKAHVNSSLAHPNKVSVEDLPFELENSRAVPSNYDGKLNFVREGTDNLVTKLSIFPTSGEDIAVVRETTAGWEERPPWHMAPVAVWIGESDPTLEDDFRKYNTIHGNGDYWITPSAIDTDLPDHPSTYSDVHIEFDASDADRWDGTADVLYEPIQAGDWKNSSATEDVVLTRDQGTPVLVRDPASGETQGSIRSSLGGNYYENEDSYWGLSLLANIEFLGPDDSMPGDNLDNTYWGGSDVKRSGAERRPGVKGGQIHHSSWNDVGVFVGVGCAKLRKNSYRSIIVYTDPEDYNTPLFKDEGELTVIDEPHVLVLVSYYTSTDNWKNEVLMKQFLIYPEDFIPPKYFAFGASVWRDSENDNKDEFDLWLSSSRHWTTKNTDFVSWDILPNPLEHRSNSPLNDVAVYSSNQYALGESAAFAFKGDDTRDSVLNSIEYMEKVFGSAKPLPEPEQIISVSESYWWT